MRISECERLTDLDAYIAVGITPYVKNTARVSRMTVSHEHLEARALCDQAIAVGTEGGGVSWALVTSLRIAYYAQRGKLQHFRSIY